MFNNFWNYYQPFEITEFLILVRYGSNLMFSFIGNIDVSQWWIECCDDESSIYMSRPLSLDDWNFKKIPHLEGIYVVSAEIHQFRDLSGLKIKGETWRLAHIDDFSRFGFALGKKPTNLLFW